MNLQEFNFPEPDWSLRTIPELLKEANERGFYDGNTKYNKLFSTLFFNGGAVDLKEGYNKKMLHYLKYFMMSFEPKHEEKDAISAMLLSELVK